MSTFRRQIFFLINLHHFTLFNNSPYNIYNNTHNNNKINSKDNNNNINFQRSSESGSLLRNSQQTMSGVISCPIVSAINLSSYTVLHN